MRAFAKATLAIAVVAVAGGISAASFFPDQVGKFVTAVRASEGGPVRVSLQLSENDPKAMNLALNNISNLATYYKAQGKKVDIQIITYGPGLHMLRADTSPVKQRIASMSLEIDGLTFNACSNTRANMAKQEGVEIPLLSEAKVVPSGVVTLIELQQKGYAYIRP